MALELKVKPRDPDLMTHASISTLVKSSGKRSRGAILLTCLPLLIAALLSGYFVCQARYDDALDRYPFTWQAHWITSPASGSNACFRKTLFVSGNVRSAYVAITADNFYELRVNGLRPLSCFRRISARTLIHRQTPYSMIGYMRQTQIAHIYDIGPLLQPGQNVVTVQVQSDESPALLLQGEINTTVRQEFGTDSSWTCAACQQQISSLDWTDPHFSDGNWAKAITHPATVQLPLDGTFAMLDAPLGGDFVSSSRITMLDSDIRLRRVIVCPGPVSNGWFRVTTTVPYTLFLNGRLIDGTALLNRYTSSMLARRNVYDSLTRVMYRNDPPYNMTNTVGSTDLYLCKDVLRRGPNLMEIVLHNPQGSGLTTLPELCMDGHLEFSEGQPQQLMTDTAWQVYDVRTNANGDWHPADAASAPSEQSPRLVSLRDKIDPGLASYQTALEWDMALLTTFLGASFVCLLALPGSVSRRWRPALLTWLPPAVIAGFAYLTQTAFATSPQEEFFDSPLFAQMVLIAAAAAWVLGCLPIVLRRIRGIEVQRPRFQFAAAPGTASTAPRLEIQPNLTKAPGLLKRYGYAGVVLLIMAGAALVYTHGLGTFDYLPDEYVSMMAARGILRHGIPVYENTGIIYTRSSLYHYLLAGFMAVTRSTTSPWTTRLPAALWALATLPVVYLFAREMQGRMAGLIAVSLTAFSPFLIYYAREARFYTQETFFLTLMFYLLLQSIRHPDRTAYRLGVALAYSAAYLSQQLAMVAAPAVILIILLTGQTRAWLRGASAAGLAIAALVMGLDYVAYIEWCQTPLPYVDTDSVMLFGLHLDYLEMMPVMLLVGNERSQLAVGSLFVGGLLILLVRLFRVPALKKTDDALRRPTLPLSWWKYLYVTSLVLITLTTLTTPRPTNRYILHALPLVTITAACVAVSLGRRLRREMLSALPTSSARFGVAIYAGSLACFALMTYHPARIWNNTNRLVNSGTSAAPRFVAAHWKPDDKLIFYSPEIAMMEVGKPDYFWRPNCSSIYCYLGKDGRLHERDSGAITVNSVDKLRQIVADNPRVWVVIHSWEYLPLQRDVNGQMSLFLKQNFQVMDEPLGMEVLLWDRSLNHYRETQPDNGTEQFDFT